MWSDISVGALEKSIYFLSDYPFLIIYAGEFIVRT